MKDRVVEAEQPSSAHHIRPKIHGASQDGRREVYGIQAIVAVDDVLQTEKITDIVVRISISAPSSEYRSLGCRY